MHSENAQVHTVVSLLLWWWAWCKVCSSSIGNGGKQRRAEMCGPFLGGLVLRRAIKWKRSRMLSNRIIILHDNDRPHIANLVRNKLQRFGWEALQHPLYSPDLSPCDLHIFGDLKKDIRGRRFHSDEEVQEWVRLWVHQRPTSFYKTAIECLVSQWDKCINISGNYFSIKQIPLSLCGGCSVFMWLPLTLNTSAFYYFHFLNTLLKVKYSKTKISL